MIEGILSGLAVKFILWKPVLYTLLSLWATVVVCFVLFLVYAAYNQAKSAGRKIPRFSKAILGPLAPPAGLLDVVFLNYFLGTIIFLQLPKPDEKTFAAHTFTRRLQQLKGLRGGPWLDIYRGIVARFFSAQLEWADPGHTK